MQYLLMLYAEEAGWNRLSEMQQRDAMASYRAYTEALKKAGVLTGVNRLQDSGTAKRVGVIQGKSQVLNGPYADSREQMGGYYLIDVPDFETAIAWAKRCPGAEHGVVEVRPVWAME
jgi:hypothetical protein